MGDQLRCDKLNMYPFVHEKYPDDETMQLGEGSYGRVSVVRITDAEIDSDFLKKLRDTTVNQFALKIIERITTQEKVLQEFANIKKFHEELRLRGENIMLFWKLMDVLNMVEGFIFYQNM